jgi:hypothetical protein
VSVPGFSGGNLFSSLQSAKMWYDSIEYYTFTNYSYTSVQFTSVQFANRV